MGGKISKHSRADPPEPSFRVLNVPEYVPSTDALSIASSPAELPDPTASAHSGYIYPPERYSYLRSARPQTAPESDYHLHAQMSALPGNLPLQQQQYKLY
ncbi:MAG: hypothetical protein L6R41_006070, partial [Letrouitia leprolyta]